MARNHAAEAAMAMDRAIQSVMPADWKGHARLAIWDADLPDQYEDAAFKLLNRKFGEYDGVRAEQIGETVVSVMESEIEKREA